MAASKLVLMLVVMVAASLQSQTTVAQTRHIVGDTMGWAVPNSAAAYTTWAATQNFTVGDTLVFNFATGQHDVAEVTMAAYGPCTLTNPISLNGTGPTTVTLKTPGAHYYVCTVGPHCTLGQKLMINVMASGGSPPSSGSPAPAGTVMPPPPPPSNASPALTAVVPATLLAVALALVY